jgi:hypothetical protein
MRKWGLVVTLFYGVLVLAFLVPAYMLLGSSSTPSAADFKEAYTSGTPWVIGVVVMLGAVLLLWLSVDETQRRLKPRTHILVSALTTGLLLAVLTLAIIFAVGFAVRGDHFFDVLPESFSLAAVLGAFLIPWAFWGILFYRLFRNSTDPVTRAMAWLLRGSVLELLIAVPVHVIIRRRHDCSAPVVNSFGITTGLAIMLLSFGPSVLLLYKKRMERYATKPSEGK